MNVIAIRYNCIKGGKGKGDTGWKRFLVFARLTDSRGLVDYIALFTYFAFKGIFYLLCVSPRQLTQGIGWARIIFAEGPRVVINTLIFISVTKASDIVQHQSNAISVFQKFGQNVEALYQQNKVQVLILGTMAFTTLMWIFAILRLLIAGCLYICFLFHAMGREASLRTYCKDRIDTRMGEIVQKKHDKALRREKQERGSFLKRQPTLPVLVDDDAISSEVNLMKKEPSLQSETSTAPPSYASREPTLSNLETGLPTPASATAQSHSPAPMSRLPPSRPVALRSERNNSFDPPSAAHDYQNQGLYSDPASHRPPPRDAFDPVVYGEYTSSQHGRAGPTVYPMHPLAPAHSGPPTFVVDRITRNNGPAATDEWGNALTRTPPPPMVPQDRFPGRPDRPPMSRNQSQRDGWDAPSASHQPSRGQLAGPRPGRGYDAPVRSHTYEPQMGGADTGYFNSSQTMQNSYYQDTYGHDTGSYEYSRQPYHPSQLPPSGGPTALSRERYAAPQRKGTAPPDFHSAMSPRSGPAPPDRRGNNDLYVTARRPAPPTRSVTAPLAEGSFDYPGPLPRAATARLPDRRRPGYQEQEYGMI
jgi:hypothetical protein